MAYTETDGEYIILGPTFDSGRLYHDRSAGNMIWDVPASTGFDWHVDGSSVMTLGSTGILTVSVQLNANAAGLRTSQAVNNVHDTAPTISELTTSFGNPATLGRGFLGTIDDNDANTIGYLVWVTDANYFFVLGTKSAA